MKTKKSCKISCATRSALISVIVYLHLHIYAGSVCVEIALFCHHHHYEQQQQQQNQYQLFNDFSQKYIKTLFLNKIVYSIEPLP